MCYKTRFSVFAGQKSFPVIPLIPLILLAPLCVVVPLIPQMCAFEFAAELPSTDFLGPIRSRNKLQKLQAAKYFFGMSRRTNFRPLLQDANFLGAPTAQGVQDTYSDANSANSYTDNLRDYCPERGRAILITVRQLAD